MRAQYIYAHIINISEFIRIMQVHPIEIKNDVYHVYTLLAAVALLEDDQTIAITATSAAIPPQEFRESKAYRCCHWILLHNRY